MPDPRKKLYSALSDKFDLGTLEEFNSKMDNPDSRQKLYKAVSASNFDLGSYEDFESKIGGKKKVRILALLQLVKNRFRDQRMVLWMDKRVRRILTDFRK